MKKVKQVKAIVCDFDGTFSTLRCGWEAVMKRMMMKYLPDEAWIDEFIGETTGVQTILQMKGFLVFYDSYACLLSSEIREVFTALIYVQP